MTKKIETVYSSLWDYCALEDTPSYDEIKKLKVISGGCYTNVVTLAEYLQKTHNIETQIYLTYGMRSYCSGHSIGYHYLIKDTAKGMFLDNQYCQWYGIALHKWSLTDYKKERGKTCFAEFYRLENAKDISKALKVVRNIYRKPFYHYNILTMSNREIDNRVFNLDDENEYVSKKPRFGTCLLKSENQVPRY